MMENSLKQTRAELNRDYIEKMYQQAAHSVFGQLPGETVNNAFSTLAKPEFQESDPVAILKFISELLLDARGVEVNITPQGLNQFGSVQDYDRLISTGEAQKCIQVKSINTVKRRIKDLKLVGLRSSDEDDYKLPEWQFTTMTPDGRIPGVDDVLHILGENGVPAERAFTTPLADYDDESIIDTLYSGNIERAKKMAQYLKTI